MNLQPSLKALSALSDKLRTFLIKSSVGSISISLKCLIPEHSSLFKAQASQAFSEKSSGSSVCW